MPPALGSGAAATGRAVSAEIKGWFAYRTPNQVQQRKVELIGNECERLICVILANTTPGTAQVRAIELVKESYMAAVSPIVLNGG